MATRTTVMVETRINGKSVKQIVKKLRLKERKIVKESAKIVSDVKLSSMILYLDKKRYFTFKDETDFVVNDN